jgi:protein TonB
MGVVNGLAQSLPKPNYPAAALAVNIQGKVDVQVLIDESGRVVSAKAVSGSPMLRQAAEVAARNARFSPTTLSNVPVKVTGVIVYNFTRS